jgi:hypothetical protein
MDRFSSIDRRFWQPISMERQISGDLRASGVSRKLQEVQAVLPKHPIFHAGFGMNIPPLPKRSISP